MKRHWPLIQAGRKTSPCTIKAKRAWSAPLRAMLCLRYAHSNSNRRSSVPMMRWPCPWYAPRLRLTCSPARRPFSRTMPPCAQQLRQPRDVLLLVAEREGLVGQQLLERLGDVRLDDHRDRLRDDAQREPPAPAPPRRRQAEERAARVHFATIAANHSALLARDEGRRRLLARVPFRRSLARELSPRARSGGGRSSSSLGRHADNTSVLAAFQAFVDGVLEQLRHGAALR